MTPGRQAISTFSTSSFYIAGGTLHRDASCYVTRQADTDLLEGLRQGQFCYVLTSRQMGKSSLMARTAARLREEGTAVAVLDLTAIGQNLTPEQWYDGLLNLLARALDLEEQMEGFWFEHERLSPLQRWMQALQEVVLKLVPGPVILFLDEIDAVRSLPFSADEFFTAIRECYNRRGEEPEYRRLSFCLLGVASPSDLIRDTRTTPFNIGRRIELSDFTLEEASPLAEGLAVAGEAALETAQALLARVLYWTGGHPYLTQRLCLAIAEGQVASSKDVDRLCGELFFAARSRETDDNLLFVREWLLRSEADRANLLDLYSLIRHGKWVGYEDKNPLISLLQLSGIVRLDKKRLKVRNRIYARVFDLDWVQTSMPEAVWNRPRPVVQAAGNLALPLSSFVGRQKEMEAVNSLLIRSRLLTLTGSGGCGKTRLALQVAAGLREAYVDGIWLVGLAALTDPTLVTQAVASALGLREEPGRTLPQTLIDYLDTKRLLVVLDNCEHLLDACAGLAETLLSRCEHLQILATSREALRVTGEQVYRVPSLLVADPALLPIEEKEIAIIVSEYDAVRLFVERASLQQPEFTLNAQNALVVASLCYRLDGIPLAIELAAARVSLLSLEQIVSRLEDRFSLLTHGVRTALPRQQTLKATLDWSYELLQEKERRLLGRLSVFAGGWTLEASRMVCAGEGIEEETVLNLMTGLVEKSLVLYDKQGHGERYWLQETVRQYGRERLEQTGETERQQRAHKNYFLALAEEAKPQLIGLEQVQWLERLEAEHANFRSALEWCTTNQEGAEAGLRLVGALWQFWTTRGFLEMGRGYLEEALAHEGAAGRTIWRARALNGAGALAQRQGDYKAARSLFEESLTLYRDLRDRWGLAHALNNLGDVIKRQSDYETARMLSEESLALFREIEDRQGIANSFANLGDVAYEQGDYKTAMIWYEESLALYRELGNKMGIAISLGKLGSTAKFKADYVTARMLYEESLALYRELGDKMGIALSVVNLGSVACAQGNDGIARMLYEESLALYRELGDKMGIAISLGNLGNVMKSQSDYETARILYTDCLTLLQEMGNKRNIAYALEAVAFLANMQRQSEPAARLMGAAQTLRAAIGSPLPTAEQDEYDRNLAAARTTLGEQAFTTAWEQGRAMTFEQAIEYALQNDRQ